MIETIKKLFSKFKEYLSTNMLMTAFVLTNLINGCLLMFFTVNNYFAIKPILADLIFLFIVIVEIISNIA